MSVGITAASAARFNGVISAWIASTKDAISASAVEMAKIAFDYVLQESPQYSGDFVANWNVNYGEPVYSFKADALGTAMVYGRGDLPAINHAESRAKWPTLPHGKTIFISNKSFHTHYYSLKIEKGKIKFRPVNAGADRVAARAIQFAAISAKNSTFKIKSAPKGSFA